MTPKKMIFTRKIKNLQRKDITHLDSCSKEFLNLWVKKYEPARYFDLLSGEVTNRKLLSWLKSWDYSVFGVEPNFLKRPNNPTITQSHVGNNATNATKAFISRFEGNFQREEDFISQLNLKDGRPAFRIALLSGPPGIGKTTLAHLVAHQAGYQVVEMNSSDDRSPSALLERLEAVVSSRTSLNASDSSPGQLKPCCLILDELDGALSPAVELLAAAARSSQQSTEAGTRRAKRRHGKLILRRPIICICNDLYATSLRSLRAPGVPCLILRMSSVDLNRLIARLGSVAKSEDLPVDKNFLIRLAESSGRDVRACLNILQFMKTSRRSHDTLSEMDLSHILGASGGLKDVQRNMFSALQSVFTIPPPQTLAQFRRAPDQPDRQLKGAIDPGSSGSTVDATLHSRVKHILDVCHSSVEPQLLNLGLFENYLNRRIKDSTLQSVIQASEWLCYSDLISHRINTTQDFGLMRYSSMLPASFSLLFASKEETVYWKTAGGNSETQSGVLRWPVSYSDNITAITKTNSILDQIINNQWHNFRASRRHPSPATDLDTGKSSLNSLQCMTKVEFLLDVAPCLVSIIHSLLSSLRPINVQLYNSRERIQLAYLVDVMLTYGLDWLSQFSSDEGASSLCLEPAISSVTAFLPASQLDKDIPQATKQIVMRALNIERVRRAEASYGEPPTTRAQDQNQEAFILSRIAPTAAPLLASDQIKIKRDFFGRPIIEPTKPKLTEDAIGSTLESVINDEVWYKFKEGHSNAVRRPFLMNQLI